MTGESSHPLPAAATPAGQPSFDVPFEAHVELVRLFLARRSEIVERIENLLNAQRKPPQYRQDAALLSRLFAQCFFTPATLTVEQLKLEHQLEHAHRASGFKPRQTPGQHNDLVEPAEMMTRAFLMWQRTRWPGHHGRARYAETLFDLYLLRRLMLLAMRVVDAGASSPAERLVQVQDLLDALSKSAPADQPVLVRDARWLFALAQSPTTDELHGYFVVAERIAETLPEKDRLEVQRAGVRMAGGHLRSQLRHVSTQQGVSLDEHELVQSTRRSNALDLATLIQSLVPLLEAYEHAVDSGDTARRVDLADSICQGISPDPELFLNRLDLLAPYSMIEHLFIATDGDAGATYTPMGRRHLGLLERYAALVRRAALPLSEDCTRFRPVTGSYSPYGVLYGFSSRILEHIALKASQPDAVTRFTLEDVFTDGGADKLAWVSGWRKLPHVPREVVKLFEYPQAFAEAVFERIERALRKHVQTGEADAAVRNGRLIVVPEDGVPRAPQPAPNLSTRYIASSDRQLVAAGKAAPCDETQLLHSRVEGEHLVSYETPHGWVAITKDVLTELVGAGRDATVAELPRNAAQVLKLMCPGFVSLAEDAAPSSFR